MPLQVIKHSNGSSVVTYTPPHPISINNTIPVPKFSEVEAAHQVVRTASPQSPEWEDAMDVIERLIYTR